ncbi:hypothetical protein V8E51_018277 [Hyaloscypha variabilis]
MANATSGLLSGLFRKEKFPDPELSVGLHLQKTRRGDHIWDAIGPAKDSFDQLERDINSHLVRFGDSVYPEVKWTFCMIGRTKESSRPTVVFFCAEKIPRQTVRAEIKSSGILKRYPGIVTMDCDRPPGFIEVVPLGESSRRLSPSPPSQLRSSNEHTKLANFEGAKIFIRNGHDMNTQDSGTATIGGVLRWEEKYFIMTVAHVFPGHRNDDIFLGMATPSEFEYDLDSGSDGEGPEDSNVETMSKGSMSSENSECDDSKSSDESTKEGLVISEPQLGLDSISSLQKDHGTIAELQLPASANASLPKVRTSKRSIDGISDPVTDANSDYSVVIHLNDGRRESFSPKFPPVFSFEGTHPILDYALVEISRFQLDDIGGGCLKEIEKQVKDGSSAVAQELPYRRTLDVIAKVSNDLMPGKLLATPTYLLSGAKYEELWSARLQGTLAKGHCGSWISEAATGKIYGHLIAGSPESGLAYLAPMREVIRDLKQRFGGEWEVVRCLCERNQEFLLGDEATSVQSMGLDNRVSPVSTKQQEKIDPCVHDFSTWYARSKIPGSITADLQNSHGFIPTSLLYAYFENSLRERLLESTTETNFPRFSSYELQLIHNRYLKVFSILLLLNHGSLIRNFMVDEKLSDSFLPFESRPAQLPNDLFDAFYEQQWSFCATVLFDQMDVEFHPRIILPITEKQKLADGGTSEVYKITLHPEYNGLIMSSRESGYALRPLGNTFVLKTFRTESAEEYWKNEVNAFRLLNPAKGRKNNLIGFYGSFRQCGTFNIILEHAIGGDLNEYLHTNLPPTNATDIYKFWCALCGITKAVVAIHNIAENLEEHKALPLSGWHQDIKPANILITGTPPNDFEFKLADLGTSHFKSRINGVEPTDVDSYGTHTYGAPECYRPDDQSPVPQVSQSVDIWSLGCIFSEAARWIVDGPLGLLDYRQQRRDAVSAHNIRDDDCFHNGNDALAFIAPMHQMLARKVNKYDTVTVQVLQQLIRKMLTVNSKRASAKEIYYHLKAILLWAEERLEDQRASGSEPIPASSSDSTKLTSVLRSMRELLPGSAKKQLERASSSSAITALAPAPEAIPTFGSGHEKESTPKSTTGSVKSSGQSQDSSSAMKASSQDNGGYCWDSVSAYRLSKGAVDSYLQDLFGFYNFFIRVYKFSLCLKSDQS